MQPTEPPAQATLLLVDDNRLNRRIFAQMIRRHMPHYIVHAAANGEEGDKMAEELLPDCAIIDLNMPGMNGIELCLRLKAREATAGFPLLLITAQDVDPETRAAGLEAGADAFVQYPYDAVDLFAQIGVLLRVKRAEDHLRAANRRLAEMAEERTLALHQSSEQYQLLQGACTDLVLQFHIEGRVLHANEAACHRLDFTLEELRGKRLRDLLPPDRVAMIPARMESLVQHNQVYLDTVFLARDGSAVQVEGHARLFASQDPPFVLFVGHPSRPDPDPRAQGILPHQTGQVIYDCHLQTGEVSWGGAVMQVLGLGQDAANALNSTHWRQAIHPEDRAAAAAAYDEAQRTVGKYLLSYRLRHADGVYRHVEDLGVVLPDEVGAAKRLLGTLTDVSARVEGAETRKRAELAQRHARKFQSLGLLAGGIAHDFNNILAAIIGLTDLSLSELPEDSTVHADLKEALQAAHRAKELVKQILTFGREATGDHIPVPLHRIAREVLQLIRTSVPPTVELVDRIDTGSGLVMAEAVQLHQIVMNYCVNAAQAVGEHGVIEVGVEDFEVGEELAAQCPGLRAGSQVRLSVRDTGTGMEPAVAARIFEPAFTTKPPGEGTGMGLANVRAIVDKLGGAIRVESTPGQGSTFHTYFPRTHLGAPREPTPDGRAQADTPVPDAAPHV